MSRKRSSGGHSPVELRPKIATILLKPANAAAISASPIRTSSCPMRDLPHTIGLQAFDREGGSPCSIVAAAIQPRDSKLPFRIRGIPRCAKSVAVPAEVCSGGEGQDRPRMASGGAEHLRAVPPGGHRLELVLPLEQGVFGGWQEAVGGGHVSLSDQR